jgi:hypothetical protein
MEFFDKYEVLPAVPERKGIGEIAGGSLGKNVECRFALVEQARRLIEAPADRPSQVALHYLFEQPCWLSTRRSCLRSQRPTADRMNVSSVLRAKHHRRR